MPLRTCPSPFCSSHFLCFTPGCVHSTLSQSEASSSGRHQRQCKASCQFEQRHKSGKWFSAGAVSFFFPPIISCLSHLCPVNPDWLTVHRVNKCGSLSWRPTSKPACVVHQKDVWLTFRRLALLEFLYLIGEQWNKGGSSCASLARRNIDNVNWSDRTDKRVKCVREQCATCRFMLYNLVPLLLNSPGTLWF